jgi:hypothetical protein
LRARRAARQYFRLYSYYREPQAALLKIRLH